MINIYYGNGLCYLDENKIVAVDITYSGDCVINPVCENHEYFNKKNRIIIYPRKKIELLHKLFKYSGEFTLLSALGIDENLEQTILKFNFISDQILFDNTKINESDIDIENKKNHLITKKNTIIKNIKYDYYINKNIEELNVDLYFKNSKLYEGEFIIDKYSLKIYAGTPINKGEELFLKSRNKLIPGNEYRIGKVNKKDA